MMRSRDRINAQCTRILAPCSCSKSATTSDDDRWRAEKLNSCTVPPPGDVGSSLGDGMKSLVVGKRSSGDLLPSMSVCGRKPKTARSVRDGGKLCSRIRTHLYFAVIIFFTFYLPNINSLQYRCIFHTGAGER